MEVKEEWMGRTSATSVLVEKVENDNNEDQWKLYF